MDARDFCTSRALCLWVWEIKKSAGGACNKQLGRGVESSTGGFFNLQNRETLRTEWEEIFRVHPLHFHGSHELQAGIEFAHSSYNGRQEFRPVEIFGLAGVPLERIQFGPTSSFPIHQNETAWFVGDKWTVSNRLTFDLGLRR